MQAQTVNVFDNALKFEAELQPGQLVQVRWTNSHHYWTAKATVVRVNGSSIRVELVEDVVYPLQRNEIAYPKGRQLVIPRASAAKWSANNRVRPLTDSKVENTIEDLTKTVDKVLGLTPGFEASTPVFAHANWKHVLEPRFNLEEFHRFEASGGSSLEDILKMGYVAFCFDCGERFKDLQEADEHGANGNPVFRIVEAHRG